MSFNLKDFIIILPTTMKLKQLILSVESLSYLSSLKLPAVTSYKLALLTKKINPDIEEFHKTRNEKLKEYGEEIMEDEKSTGKFNIKQENIEIFNKEIDDLLETELNIDIPDVSISEFSGINIEPKYFIELEWLIKS